MKIKLLYAITLIFLITSCAGVPENVKPVNEFDIDRYMGTWYEIARLDHGFERGLEQVSATYSKNDNGSTVKVVNKGFKTKSNEWKEAVGKARFANETDVGHLEVSFFGPFYGPYVIFELDKENYQYSYVTSSKGMLWFLSRTQTVSESSKSRFINASRRLGYDVESLIFVNQQ